MSLKLNIPQIEFKYKLVKNGLLTIPENITNIRYGAFLKCKDLISLTLHEDITSIGDYAFSECSGLKSVIIPQKCAYIGGYAFYKCFGLISLTIPEGVKCIGVSAFLKCNKLTSLKIPSSVTSIWQYAFYGCTELTSVTIQGQFFAFGENAFKYCTKLKYFIIPRESMNELINYNFFQYCFDYDYTTNLITKPLTAYMCKSKTFDSISAKQSKNILCLIMICKIKFELPQEMIDYILDFVIIDDLYLIKLN